MKEKIIGVVLAGGQSKRFGSPKAFAKRDGKEFYKYSIDALKPLADRTVIVTNEQLKKFFHHDGVDIITDKKQMKRQGPLAGIYTAMDTFSAIWYAVLPVDVPFISDRMMKILANHLDYNIDIVVPIVSGQIQPLIAFYKFSVKNLINRKLKQGERSVVSIFDHCKVTYVTIEEERPFYNINQRREYDQWVGNSFESE